MKSLLMILTICLCACCASTKSPESSSPLTGTWIYSECRIKNTSVRGTITFRTNGTFEIDATARDDYPVGIIRGVYSYKESGSMILTDYSKGYGMSLYYYIVDDELFFTNTAPGRNGETGSWIYRLQRSR